MSVGYFCDLCEWRIVRERVSKLSLARPYLSLDGDVLYPSDLRETWDLCPTCDKKIHECIKNLRNV